VSFSNYRIYSCDITTTYVGDCGWMRGFAAFGIPTTYIYIFDKDKSISESVYFALSKVYSNDELMEDEFWITYYFEYYADNEDALKGSEDYYTKFKKDFDGTNISGIFTSKAFGTHILFKKETIDKQTIQEKNSTAVEALELLGFGVKDKSIAYKEFEKCINVHGEEFYYININI